MIVKGNIVDIHNRFIYPGEIEIQSGKIIRIEKINEACEGYILPGFVDAHIHIESSMLVPSEFARIAVLHGTVATVSDPHEIANVLGIPGVQYMIANGKKTPFKFNFGAPSCVPATTFESAGAVIDAAGIKELLSDPDIKYLAEMMNYPGVLMQDSKVMQKIEWAKHFNKPVDGHAPGLTGVDAKKYIEAGISTDHECFTAEEAAFKLANGMKILIREGSAAKNFNALIGLSKAHYKNMMFCSDDKHPDDLLIGHINLLVKRAIAAGYDLFHTLEMACINPVEHYKLDVGLLKKGDPADFIVAKDLVNFEVQKTILNGIVVAEDGTSFIDAVPFETPNQFNVLPKSVDDFKIKAEGNQIRIIEALDGELITKELVADSKIEGENLVSDIERDLLKMTVVNRYQDQAPALAFIKNVGLKEGAIASSVGHDSHNIIAVGVSDEMICKAVNAVIESKGGIAAVNKNSTEVLPLPVAGIMSDQDAKTTGQAYEKLDQMAKNMGATLKAPYMTLSFMALLVIPSLKLSDKGLFDGNQFKFTPLQIKS